MSIKIKKFVNEFNKEPLILNKGYSNINYSLFDLLIRDIFSFKRIEELPYNHLLFLNNIISLGAYKDLNEIEKLTKIIANIDIKDIYSNEVIVFYISILFGYYLDNNFLDKLDEFILTSNLDTEKFYQSVFNLLEKYKGTDYYVIISKNVQGFLFYIDIDKKRVSLEKSNKADEVLDLSKDRLNYLVEELNYLYENYKHDRFYLNYINTLLSYYSYDFIYINYFSKPDKDSILKKLKDTLKKHIDYIGKNISKFDKHLAVVLINHLYFYKDYLNLDFNFNKSDNFQIDQDKYFYLYNYILEFSGIDINKNKQIKGLPNLKNILSNNFSKIFATATTLSIYSYFQNIRIVTSLFKDFLLKNYGDNILRDFDEIKNIEIYHIDSIYYFLKDKVESMVGFNETKIYNLIRLFLIKYVGINANLVNLDVNLSFNTNINYRLKNIKFLSSFTMKGRTSIENIYKDGDVEYTLKIYFPNNSNFNVLVDNLNSNKVKSFLNTIIDKFLKLNSFLNSLDLKLSKLQKHPETLKHMESISGLFEMLDGGYDTEKLKNTLPLKRRDFYLLLGYLHDIGKADNVDLIDLYENTNTRTDPYYAFLKFLEKLFKDTDFSCSVKEETKSVIRIEDIYNSICMDDNFKSISMLFFSDIKKFNFSSIGDNNYYLDIIVKYGIKIMEIVNLKLDSIGLDYKIFNNSFRMLNESDLFSFYFRDLLNKYKKNCSCFNIETFFLGVLLLFIDSAKMQVKEITTPHITYGLQFFQLNPEYNYLSFVLYHHSNYPLKEEIVYYNCDKGLDKYKKVLGIENKFLENIDLNQSIKPEDKDYLMVLLTACDLIDALLSGRKYQKSIDLSEFSIMNILSSEFRYELNKLFTLEDNTDLEKIFDRAIFILDREFWKNIHYTSKLKLKLLKNREYIISMYKK